MTGIGKRILSLLLWTWGGTVYFLLEVVWKLAHDEPEQISWTMLVLAFILCIPVERAGAELPWECPLWAQALVCAALVTAAELAAGLVLNVWLGLDIWDYSGLRWNLWGQVCPQFFLVWLVLCFMFIPVFDWMWYSIVGGEKPKYYIR